MTLASELGFTVPDTLVSNDPEDVLDFYTRHAGRIISKRAAFSRLNEHADHFYRWHRARMSRRDLGYVDAVRFCPMIFQAYVPKALELRITVIGDHILAAKMYLRRATIPDTIGADTTTIARGTEFMTCR